jgi:benzoyl-CoA reductase/2-hydroxyglutaryl-CoA dehydratase subunit BcrC/BadD/HgdB
MVAGGQIDDPMFTDVIESQGALVAADRYCTGSIPGLAPIETGMDPIKALARNIFRRTGCPRIQGGFEERLAGLLNAVREYSIDGVILESVKFCDIWGVETGAMARALREAGVPALRLDREYRPGGEGQIQTRVQAFLESMGR